MNSAVWLALLGMAIGAQPAADLSVDEVVRRVQVRFDSTADFTADVDQELVLLSGGKTVTARGSVAFKRPGRMRWSLHNHDQQIIVADGGTLWLYQPDERQVLKSSFQSAFRSSSPVSFLSGVGRIEEDFVATLDGRDANHLFLLLVPRRDEGEIGRLRLTIDPADYGIVGAEVRDPLGNVTRLRFSEVRRNVGLDDALFRFEIPPGVDVIEAPIGY